MLRHCAFSISLICLAHAEPITLTPVATGLKRPVDFAMSPADPDHFYIVEQDGKILKIEAKTGEKVSTVLDLTGHVSRGHNEEGLLGMTFSPTFAEDHRLYLYYTRGKGKKNEPRKTYISRFLMNGEAVDRNSEEVLLSFKQDFGNHNGGWISFGPDNFLYLGVGDGGKANDPKNRAQDLNNLLGSILRIDVSGKSGYDIPKENPFIGKEEARPEIYSYGLRDPWRCSFDMKTGDLWIADVGQNAWEEINFSPAGKAQGANFGWRLREGKIQTPKKKVGGSSPSGEHKPIYVYDHNMSKNTGGLSVTGGYVHRGKREDLNGRYFFTDYISRHLWSFQEDDGEMKDFIDHTETMTLPEGSSLSPISSFGQDLNGEVYLLDFSGTVYLIQ